MTTVLRVHGDGDSSRARSCARRCYDSATDPKHCRCVCGGALHGSGLRAALEEAPKLWLGTYHDGVLVVHKRDRGGRFNQTTPTGRS